MAISKTGGIQLSSEINNELSQGRNLGAYRGEFFLHVPSNTRRIIPTTKSISFSQLDGCTKLGDNTPLTPGVTLLSQSTLVTNNSVSPSGTTSLSVNWKSENNPNEQPVLAYDVTQNVPVPRTRWYETTGGGFVDVTSSMNATDTRNYVGRITLPRGGTIGPLYNITSQLLVPLDTAGTRTFVARGEAFTSRNDTASVVATATEQFPEYTVNRTIGNAPTATFRSKLIPTLRNPEKRTIVIYSNGQPTYYPQFTLGFYFKIYDRSDTQFIPDTSGFDLPERHNGYVATGNPYWDYTVYRSLNSGVETNVTSDFGFTNVFEPSFGSIDPMEFWTRLTANIKYTVAGNYKYRFVVFRKRAYTSPTGSAVTISVPVPQQTQEVIIGSKTIENRKPTLLGLSIDKSQVDENPNRSAFNPTEDMKFTVTVQTQHAIGQYITIGKSPANDSPQLLPSGLSKLLIESNDQSFTLGAGVNGSYVSTSRKSDDRTLTISASPYDSSEWESASSVSDSILVKNNAPFGARLLTKSVDKNTVNEGESFTYTLEGMDFTVTDYTWETTFPSAAVSATTGTFSTPYTGSLHTGRYSGSFTVDTVVRANHYEDVTGGQIKVFKNGTLYVQTGAKLKIKNTHAEPVTLPTKTADPSHSVHAKAGYNGLAYSDTIYCIVALKTDGTYTVNNDIFGFETKDYASPQPLEGDWVPRITSAGKISRTISREDYLFNVSPSGMATAKASFSDTTATLQLTARFLVSSMASASCTFNWEFYNTSSQATRPGGTISTNIFLDTLPTGIIDIWVEPEGGIYGGGREPVSPVKIIIDDRDVFEPATNQVITVDEGDPDQDPFVNPHPTAGTILDTYCEGTTKYGNYANGLGGSYNAIIELNSTSCGYVKPKKAVQQAPTTGTTAGTIEIYSEAEIQRSIQEALDEIGVIDLSDILAGISLNIGF